MVQIANTGHNPIAFREKGGTVIEIQPGDAKPVDIDRKHTRVTAYENARLIKVGGTEAQAKKVAAKSAAAPAAPKPEAAEASANE